MAASSTDTYILLTVVGITWLGERVDEERCQWPGVPASFVEEVIGGPGGLNKHKDSGSVFAADEDVALTESY